uniref:Conserved plasma membrane protein n=1 Tax=Panagrellus redivivus TaxID=6233 RepID=A0A7E4V7R6_PANRE
MNECISDMPMDPQPDPIPRPATPANTSNEDEEAPIDHNNSHQTENIDLPGIGEFQEIIDRHTRYMEVPAVRKSGPISSGSLSPDTVPLRPHVIPMPEEVYANIIEPGFEYSDQAEVSFGTDGWYSTIVMLAALIVLILAFMCLKQLGIKPLEVLKIFPFLWILACVILCAIMYMGYRMERMNKTRINHEQFQRLVHALNLPRSMPCLLPGDHDLHGCQDEPWSEPCLGLPPRLPTYASSLDCARPKQDGITPPPYVCDYDRPPSSLAPPPAYEDANQTSSNSSER